MIIMFGDHFKEHNENTVLTILTKLTQVHKIHVCKKQAGTDLGLRLEK